jgi:hypothetical protein
MNPKVTLAIKAVLTLAFAAAGGAKLAGAEIPAVVLAVLAALVLWAGPPPFPSSPGSRRLRRRAAPDRPLGQALLQQCRLEGLGSWLMHKVPKTAVAAPARRSCAALWCAVGLEPVANTISLKYVCHWEDATTAQSAPQPSPKPPTPA